MRMKPAYKALQTRYVHKAEEAASKRKKCPKCEKNRLISKFGFRTRHDKKTGKPVQTLVQSYCSDCRKG